MAQSNALNKVVQKILSGKPAGILWRMIFNKAAGLCTIFDEAAGLLALCVHIMEERCMEIKYEFYGRVR